MTGVCMTLQTRLQMHQHVGGNAGMVKTTARYPLDKTLKRSPCMVKHYLNLQHGGIIYGRDDVMGSVTSPSLG